MSILENIKASGRIKKRINWPGTENKVDIRILNEEDLLQANLAADKIFSDTKIVLFDKETYLDELDTQRLFRVLEDPETGKKLFNNISDFRMTLSPEVKDALVGEMNNLHNQYSPTPEELSDEDFDKLIANIKKNAKQTVGNVSNIHTLRRLVLYLAKNIWK